MSSSLTLCWNILFIPHFQSFPPTSLKSSCWRFNSFFPHSRGPGWRTCCSSPAGVSRVLLPGIFTTVLSFPSESFVSRSWKLLLLEKHYELAGVRVAARESNPRKFIGKWLNSPGATWLRRHWRQGLEHCPQGVASASLYVCWFVFKTYPICR